MTATRPARPVVAVTGADAPLEAALVRLLAADPDVRRVMAVTPGESSGDGSRVRPRRADVRSPDLAGAVAGADVVVHLAAAVDPDLPREQRRGLVVDGAATVLMAAYAAGVRRVVLMTTAMVYGARPDNAVPLPEDAPLRAPMEPTVLGELLEVEDLARRAPAVHPGLAVTVLRPATLVGPGAPPGFARHLDGPRLLVVRGHRARWQFCHVEDLVSAAGLAALGRVAGAVTVGCEGWLEAEEVAALAGLRRVELPLGVAADTARRLHRVGATGAAASELDYLVHPWVVGSQRLRAAGWSPTWDNAAAVQAHLEQVRAERAGLLGRVDGRQAAAAGAGATVALVGTAALVRRARRRRRG